MHTRSRLLLVAIVITLSVAKGHAEGKIIGVSWSNFQEERWKTDEAAMKAAIEAAGNTYISADAQSSVAKQISDIEALIGQGADALIIVAQDPSSISPAVDMAVAEGIPVIGYDRLIENPGVFYLSFDNKEVGRMQARAILEAQPKGNYAFIKGSSADPNADILFSGQLEVLQEAIESGAINNVGEAYTDGWLPANAQRNMEQFLTANSSAIDAVLASNDGSAGGVVAALEAQGLAGSVPVSGQGADHDALNRIALGTQTMSVWKDSRELGNVAAEIAGLLAEGIAFESLPGAVSWAEGPNSIEMNAILLQPLPITQDNLNVVIDAGWVSKDEVCRGVAVGSVAACDDVLAQASARRPLLDICFASDRRQQSGNIAGFTHERSRELTLGFSKVSVPLDRKFGDSGRPGTLEWLWITYGRGSEDPNRHFIVKDSRVLTEDEFRSRSKAILSLSSTYKNHAIVFVHGFNVTFEQSLFTTAQLVTDMNFDGLPCVYSWPSMGVISGPGYIYDSNSARQTRDRLANFLSLLEDIDGADHISIIAHSMGSVALIEAIRQFAVLGDDEPKPYSQIILAAPDMDRDDFRGVADKLSVFARGVTLYASSNDKALIASKQLASDIERAGDVPADGPIILPNIDSIDASAVSNYVFGLNHSYYADNRLVLTDIAQLLLKGERPRVRNPTLREELGSGGSYWRFPR
jgi:D-xylose transport system substrate-binding protein